MSAPYAIVAVNPGDSPDDGSHTLQDARLDTYEANRALGWRDDERDYTVAAKTRYGAHLLDVRFEDAAASEG